MFLKGAWDSVGVGMAARTARVIDARPSFGFPLSHQRLHGYGIRRKTEH
jgi:hypothetical protein